MTVSLVKSSQNKAYQLTRVPQRWLDAIKRKTGPVQPACTASLSSAGLDQIKIVCGPTWFAIWHHLPQQDAASVINQLKALFYERGRPTDILTDNDTVFRTSQFKTFLDKWRVRLRFRCANVPSGNSIIERCHRTVKRIATRKRCTIPEAVYWYNITPKTDTECRAMWKMCDP